MPHCRCANCFDCPCCMHTLSTRATNVPAPLPDDPTKTAMKKAYYLACGFCRWTSRDVGMADKSVGGSWNNSRQSEKKSGVIRTILQVIFFSSLSLSLNFRMFFAFCSPQPAVDGKSQRIPILSGWVFVSWPFYYLEVIRCFPIMRQLFLDRCVLINNTSV